MIFDENIAFNAVQKISCLSLLISCFEKLSTYDKFDDSGFYSWPINSLRLYKTLLRNYWRILTRLFAYPNLLIIFVLQAVLSIMLLSGIFSTPLNSGCLFVIVISQLLLMLRSPYGNDGSDQMLQIIFTGLLISWAINTDNSKLLFFWFISFQTCLAYLTAGVAKASASKWRNGINLTNILSTQLYGNERFLNLLKNYPATSKYMSRILIIGECCFPLGIMLSPTSAMIFLIAGFCFHLSIALLMGLNTFFWSFIATYPAIYFLAVQRSP